MFQLSKIIQFTYFLFFSLGDELKADKSRQLSNNERDYIYDEIFSNSQTSDNEYDYKENDQSEEFTDQLCKTVANDGYNCVPKNQCKDKKVPIATIGGRIGLIPKKDDLICKDVSQTCCHESSITKPVVENKPKGK